MSAFLKFVFRTALRYSLVAASATLLIFVAARVTPRALAHLIKIDFEGDNSPPQNPGESEITDGTTWHNSTAPDEILGDPVDVREALSGRGSAGFIVVKHGSSEEPNSSGEETTANGAAWEALLQNRAQGPNGAPFTITLGRLLPDTAYTVAAYDGGKTTDLSTAGWSSMTVEGGSTTFFSADTSNEESVTDKNGGNGTIAATAPVESNISGIQIAGAVPEPESWVVLLLGSVLVIGLSRWRGRVKVALS
jgi:hypothetical protein